MTNLRSLLLKLHHADELPGTLLEAEGDQGVEVKTICGETLVRELITAIDCCLCRDEVNPASRAQPKGLRT